MRNSVRLIGHLGSDATVHDGKNGKAVRFSIATNEYKVNAKGEKEEQTTWHKVVSFRENHQNLAKFLLSGGQVAVDGKLSYGSYEDKEGHKVNTTDIIAREIVLLSKKEA